MQRQIPGNVVVSVGYTRRETRRNIGYRNVAVPLESYIPLQVTEVNSGRQVTVYNQAPALRGRTDNLWANFSELDTNFNGADITVNKRLSNHWSMTGGASYGKTTGDIYATLATVRSQQSQQHVPPTGLSATTCRTRTGCPACTSCPTQISLSGTAQSYKGFPDTTTVSVGNNTVALTQGTQVLTVEPRGTTRLPAVSSLDVSVRKRLEGERKDRSNHDSISTTSPTSHASSDGSPSWDRPTAG